MKSSSKAPHRAGVRGGDPAVRVLFRAPAGSRRGFGHLVRCLSLARALGVRPLIALRGSRDASDVALALGAELVASPSRRTLRALAPDVVVIDDPVAASARRWIAAARRAGAIVVTIHDLGLGAPEGDLVIDASLARRSPSEGGRARGPKGSLSLSGSRYALIDPRIAEFLPVGRALSGSPGGPEKVRPTGRDINHTGRGVKRVVISLGGGPHAETADAIAEAITAADPLAEVRIVAGFVAPRRASRPRVRWTTATNGLAPELANADVAIVGGGMSLYEACAMGVPAVALPVVAAQTPTVRAFAQRGAAIAVPAFAKSGRKATRPSSAGSSVRSGGPTRRAGNCAQVRKAADAAVKLLNNPRQRAALARRSTELVDGRGAWRAAAAVERLAAGTDRARQCLLVGSRSEPTFAQRG